MSATERYIRDSVHCTRCGAFATRDCLTPKGEPAPRVHRARVKLFDRWMTVGVNVIRPRTAHDEWLVIQGVRCPACAAIIGKDCLTNKGTTRKAHIQRINLYRYYVRNVAQGSQVAS